jgi:outer membrane protein assembly factor BamA
MPATIGFVMVERRTDMRPFNSSTLLPLLAAAVLPVIECGGPAANAATSLLPGIQSRAPSANAGPAPPIPPLSTLIHDGARIGAVQLRTRDLFDVAGSDDDTTLARIANRLHIQTRDRVIAQQLLVHPGDRFDPRLLEESARILRDTRYLRDAEVRPVAYHDGAVDVEVVTQDVWTLNPGISFGRAGGKSTSGFEIEELNLLGLGTQFGVGFKSEVDRDSTSLYYRDRQLGSSWWDMSLRYSDNSDGRLGEVAFDHPFYALDSHWASGVSLRDDARIDARYDRGEIIDEYQTRQRYASAYWGRSAGLRSGWARRWTVGLTYDDHAFADVPSASAARLRPDDRRLVYPWVGVEWLEDDYRTDRNRDQIGRTEDYSLGWRVQGRLGLSSTSFGSDRSAVMLSSSLSNGIALSDRQTLLWSAGYAGRLEGGSMANGLFDAEARYYFRQSPRRVFFVTGAMQLGARLDSDQQVLLGGDNGLRGYPLRYQSGSGRWLFTAEQRFFTNWYPFQLFNVGAAAFFDMGSTWGRDPLGERSQGVLKDVGVGLRLGNSRSALGNVLHLDVAVPLDGGSSIKNLQFLIQTKHRF